jgi:demethylmenaquinone methyltransferase/2-methoxy-6-polyprenyl-1,4-benzoquinol methylase
MLSFGLDRRWKRRLVNLAAPRPGDLALDLATGTGDIAFAIDGRCRRVVGLDVTPRMIELAKAKASMKQPRASDLPAFLVGDMIALPFPDASFDLVTTGYGLRNVPDLPAAIDEIRRVLKPGGRALSLDFNRPANALVRSLYLQYLTMVGGALGWILHGDPDHVSVHSGLDSRLSRRGGRRAAHGAPGFTRVRYSRVLGGLMAIHQGYKPDET